MTGEQRREQILAVARRRLAAAGYQATSVERIAEAAGISKPVVYEHFGGKESIYRVLVDREVRQLTGRIAAALDAPHPRAAVEQAARAFLTYIEEESDGFRLLVRDAPAGPGETSFASLIGDIAERVSGVFAVEFRVRGLDERDAPLYARALVGMVALVGEWWLDEQSPSREQVEAHLVNLAWNGLKGLEVDPPPPS